MKITELSPFYAALFLIVGLLSVFLFFKPENPFADPMKEGLGAYRKKDYKTAMIRFKIAESLRIPEASFALGAMHFSGTGTDVDIPQALSYYQKAAELNYAPAMTTLAMLYMNGRFVPKNAKKAVALAEKAAQLNDVEAQIMLAGWFENGTLVEQDVPSAIRYYEMAARNGNINAKIALSVIYKDGKGSVTANPYTAKRWSDSIQKQRKLNNLFQNLPADYIETVKP